MKIEKQWKIIKKYRTLVSSLQDHLDTIEGITENM
jgi:hypothetical protein